MTVTLTSPVFGKQVDDTYTGPEEAWLLANGYAKQASYTGIGVSNTGLASTPPSKDLTLAENREDAPAGIDPAHPGANYPDPGPLDPAMTFTTADDDPNDEDPQGYDYDPAGVNNDAPTVDSVVGTLHAAGGNAVTIKGRDFTGSTGAALGGTAFTSVVVVDDETITAVSPAKTAGTYSLTVTNVTGTGTKTGVVVAA